MKTKHNQNDTKEQKRNQEIKLNQLTMSTYDY
jgi:hypothetical protein